MNAERLLQHFERISEALDAIPRLRQFILDLAVQSHLVPQDPNDEPAAELLKRIQVDKGCLAHAGLIKRLKATPLIDASEVPCPLPATWEWVRVGDLLLGDSQNGYSKKPDDAVNGIPILRISAGTIRKDGIVAEEEHKLIGGVPPPQQEQYQLQPGDLLACRFNGNRNFVGRLSLYLGYLGINPIYPDKLIRLRLLSKFVLPKLVRCFAESSVVRRDIEGYCATTVGNWGISASNLKEVKIPLPPLAEQHRIVAKVDELMTLCDQLETARTEREQSRDRLVAACLHRLNFPADTAEADAPDLPALQADAFRDHARFVFKHLPCLTTRPEHIKQLRQTILNLAVRGKLVPQDPNDESASDFLSKLVEEKSKAGVGTTGRNWVGGIKEDVHEAFPAPRGWSWTRIANAVERVTVGYVGPMKDQYVERGIPFLRSQNVRPNRFRADGLIYISQTFHRTIAKSALAPGDVVVVRSGNVGTACVIPQFLLEANCSDLVVVKNPTAVLSEYLCFYLNSWAISHIEEGSVGVALTHFNTKSVAMIPLPLPPLAEQHRIVARVDELMALCDQLEAQLTTTEADSRRLLEAVLHEALAPVLEETV